jgi:hypothetical protein
MDRLLAMYFDMPYEHLLGWMQPGRYVSGREFAAAGLAEMLDFAGKDNPLIRERTSAGTKGSRA